MPCPPGPPPVDCNVPNILLPPFNPIGPHEAAPLPPFPTVTEIADPDDNEYDGSCIKPPAPPPPTAPPPPPATHNASTFPVAPEHVGVKFVVYVPTYLTFCAS